MARAFQALALCNQGCFAEGAVVADEAIALGKRLRHPFSSAVAYWIAGALHAVKGDLARATVLLEHGLAHCRDWSLIFAEAAVASWLGYTYAMSNRLADGLGLIEPAVERMDAIRYMPGRFWGCWVLGHACTLVGRLDDARRAAERASADARELGAPGLEAWARWLLVTIEVESEGLRVDIAERYAAEGIAVATGLGLRPVIAHCHAELAKLYRRTGQQLEADEHFQTARSMYGEMGMTETCLRNPLDPAHVGR